MTIDKTLNDILNHFAEYAKYDPDQKRFNLLSDNYEFHQAGKVMEMLISEYDPSGVLAVMYAKREFLNSLKKRVDLGSLIFAMAGDDPEYMDELQRILSMYRDFNSDAYKQAVTGYIDDMNTLIQQVSKMKLIGDRNSGMEEDEFISTIMQVSDDLKKLRLDLYQTSGRAVAKIEKFTPRVLVFERMADAILHLEQMPDAIYLCYIRQQNTADGYFAFVFKSNGNLFSLNDRVPEEYIGQHQYSRNGRWTEDHADSIFPYEFVFSYGEHDCKGYASKYFIDDEKLEFSQMGTAAYQPLLICMLILRNSYENKILDTEPVYLNSLFRDNFIGTHSDTELAILKNSPLALRHSEYQCGIDPGKVLTEEYNEKFHLHRIGAFWVKLYGDGFKPDFTDLLTIKKPRKLLKQWQIDNGKEQPEQEYYPEFIGTKDQMDREVYYKIRMQLAEYIQDRMKQEYAEWGSGKLYSYVADKLKASKEAFLDLVFQKHFLAKHPEYIDDFAETDPESDRASNPDPLIALHPFVSKMDLVKQIQLEDNGSLVSFRSVILNNEDTLTRIYRGYAPLKDDKTGKNCTLYASLSFTDYAQVEKMIGEPLPRIYQGWGTHCYNGNSILDVTDAVGDLRGILSSQVFSPIVTMGFSKKSFQKSYEEWMKIHGYESVLLKEKEESEKKKEEKRLEELEKKKLPSVPFEESEAYKQCQGMAMEYKNMSEVLHAAKELYQFFPNASITEYSHGTKNDDDRYVYHVSTNIPERGNADKINTLVNLGWQKGRRSKRYDGMYIQMLKVLPLQP